MKQNLNGIRFSMSNFRPFCAAEVGWQSGFECSGASADEGFLRELPIRSGCKQTLGPGGKQPKIERFGRRKKVEDLFDTGRSFSVNMRRFIGSVHLWV
jgi:hypothetical protein